MQSCNGLFCLEISVTLALVQLLRRPGLSAVENIKCNHELRQKRSCNHSRPPSGPAGSASGGATYHKCRIGVAACNTASMAPPLSRNQTLCSSSKICIGDTFITLVTSQQGGSPKGECAPSHLSPGISCVGRYKHPGVGGQLWTNVP